MSQLTAKQSTTTLEIQPALPSKSAETDLSILFNAMENGAIPRYAALSQERRGELERQLADYEAWLRPASPDEIRMDLLTLIAAFPRRAEDEDSRDIKIGVYTAALAECPKWAVHRAVKAYITGRAGDKKWAPLPPQLASECANYTLPYLMAVNRISRALAAKVDETYPASNRKRVAEGLNALARDLGAVDGSVSQSGRGVNLPPEVAKAMAEARLQEMLDAGPELVTVSPGLAAKF